MRSESAAQVYLTGQAIRTSGVSTIGVWLEDRPIGIEAPDRKEPTAVDPPKLIDIVATKAIFANGLHNARAFGFVAFHIDDFVHHHRDPAAWLHLGQVLVEGCLSYHSYWFIVCVSGILEQTVVGEKIHHVVSQAASRVPAVLRSQFADRETGFDGFKAACDVCHRCPRESLA
jgi:hypothetical protein